MSYNKELRRKIVSKAYEHGLPHTPSALSCLDSIAFLYDRVMKPEDAFILSKGHGAMALYAVLESHGIPQHWTVHPEYDLKKGILATTGSLGHGLPIGVGRAYAKKLAHTGGRTFVVLGDAEMAEGSNWEALSLANALKVDLTAVVDLNNKGVLGPISEYGLGERQIAERLEAFGCRTQVINGHDPVQLESLRSLTPGLQAVVMKTKRGKGVPVLEAFDGHHFDWRKNERAYRETLEYLSR